MTELFRYLWKPLTLFTYNAYIIPSKNISLNSFSYNKSKKNDRLFTFVYFENQYECVDSNR